MSILTIVLFCIYCWGLGFTVLRLVKEREDPIERHIMRIGIGLGVFVLLGVILNLFHIPLDWKIFLVLGMIAPFSRFPDLFKRKYDFKIKKTHIYSILMILLFAATFFMYTRGAFSYPWLEDDDSWGHAKSMRYVAEAKTAYQPEIDRNIMHFTDPYPPGYAILMGILRQTSSDTIWTLKFFNALVISLGILFFYFFAKRFTGKEEYAVLVTFIFAMIPAYLSHFIWALSLSVTLIFPFFYALENLKKESKWWIISSILFASILLVQPSSALKIAFLFLIYALINSVYNRSLFKYYAIITIIGVILSFAWWGAVFYNYGSFTENEWPHVFDKALRPQPEAHTGIFKIIGSADRVYTFQDFFIVRLVNMINNPVGIGAFACVLIALAIPFMIINLKSFKKKENSWVVIALAWSIFAFLGIHGARLPIQFIAFRFWMFFAIISAFLMLYSIIMLVKYTPKIKYIILIVFMLGIVVTSGYPKYAINTSMWPPGVLWASSAELNGYLLLSETLEKGTKIFPLCPYGPRKILAFDYNFCVDCVEDWEQFYLAYNTTPEELHSFIVEKRYNYILVDQQCISFYGLNETREFINNLGSSGLFFKAADIDVPLLMGVII